MLYGKVWVKGVAISFLSFIFSWLALEGISSLLLHWKQRPAAQYDTPSDKDEPLKNSLVLVRNDALGIVRPAPGPYEVSYRIKQPATGNRHLSPLQKQVSITYHIDSLSRRITPFNTQRAVGKYALFLGCSFTYGESVSDSNTIPYYFGQATGFRPYNYGVSGYSPAHMIALQQSVNMRNQIAEKDGIAIYTYIEDHLARVAPSTKWIYNSNGYWPYVNPKTVAVEGTYGQKHPITLQLINGMYKSNIVNLFNINFPRRYSTEQYEQFVTIVKKSEQLYRNQFGNDNFYVVIFPAYPMAPELRQLFQQAQLKVIDYSTLLSWKTTFDGMHPDGDAYKRVAEKLAHDLHLKSI
ncbi:hypothetical protein GCM10028818_14950 [Spirosoma horti]